MPPSGRIARIEAFDLTRPLDGTAWNPSWRWHERRAPLLRLTAPDGVRGLGEAWSDPADPTAIHPHLHAAAAALLAGRPALPATDRHAAAANSAIDIARWDLHARRAGQPLHALLGSRDDRTPVYASGGLYQDGKDTAALAAEMAGYTARGFTAVKMKIAALPLADDLDRLAAVRAAAGPDATIIVDAVEQLTRHTAPAWIDALARHGVTLLQAPLPTSRPDDLAALQATVIAGEREYRPDAFQALLDHRAVGLLQVNPGLAGGITGARALIAMAHRAGIRTTLQCYSTAILQAACFHLAAGNPAVHSAEFHQFHTSLYEALPPAMTAIRDGHLHLGTRPGLGLDPDLLDRHVGRHPGIRPLFTLPA